MVVTQEKRLFTIGFFFSFCIALAAYVNASYLKNFISTEQVGIVYSSVAFLTILCLYYFEYIGGKYGVQKTLVASLVISGVSSLLLSKSTTIFSSILFFIGMQVSLVITKFSADILVETHKNQNQGEGGLRGAYLAITNFTWIAAALLGGYVANTEPRYIYIIDGIIYLCVSLVALFFVSQTKKDIFTQTSILEKIKFTLSEISTKKIIVSEFVLQVFYVVMVIFSPLYLKEISGFSYTQIGTIFAIMLIPFAVLQYPLGLLADKKYGEKELLILGYTLMTLSVFAFAMIQTHTMFSAALILLISRIGACTVEVMNDTYFFSTTKNYKKTLPIFKGMAPLALFMIGAIGSTIVTKFSYTTLFSALGLFILLISFVNIYNLKDTK